MVLANSLELSQFEASQSCKRPLAASGAPGGAYEVTKQLPHNGREFEYRIKSAGEEHEHVAGESELNRP
jgi:hypothetical protein